MKRTALLLLMTISTSLLRGGTEASAPAANASNHMERLGDFAVVQGIRNNALVGYGLVVGLNRTGDSQQTLFSTQSIANALRKLGVQVSGSLIQTRNVASVFVTAELPPFARPGERIDVNVASIGDAKSLQGGVLLMTPLDGPDGRVYAVAQGPLILGGYSAGGRNNSTQENHPTTARIPSGASVEQDTAIDLNRMKTLSLLLRDANFTTAEETATTINQSLGRHVATAIDSRRIDVDVVACGQRVPEIMASIENLQIKVQPRAKVVVNERTGTVVLGKQVTLGAASIMHGNLVVEITTTFQVSQPAPFSSGGKTEVVPQTTVQASQSPARRVELREGATVDELVSGLLAIGATPRDIGAILEALRSAGSLQAEVEVI